MQREYTVLSTDPKPVNGVDMGSILVEVDTGNVFFFNESAGEWVEQFSLMDGGGGGNPNRVETITGTLADPWGEGFDGVDFSNNLADNNITAYIDITYGGQTNRAYFYTFIGYIIAGQATIGSTLTEADAFMLSYAIGQTPDLKAANLLHAGNILDLSEEADNIPTTLTIIWHPLPT